MENEGSKAGVPVETPKGSRWGVPLLETPHFPTRKYKITRILVFLIVFHNVTGEQLNIELFLILTVRLGLSQPLNEAAVFVLILTPAVVGNPLNCEPQRRARVDESIFNPLACVAQR